MHTSPHRPARIPTRTPRVVGQRRRLTVALAGTGLLATMFALQHIPTAAAADGIQRCIGSDGTVAYTDHACAALGATATPISDELLTRIAREQAAEASGAEAGFDRTARAAKPVVARRSAASGCARSPTQLSMDLQGSWALGDVNRIAESYHWTGLGHAQGQQIMQRLDRLSGKPLSRVHYFDARIGSGAMQLADAGGGSAGLAGIMQVVLGNGTARTVQDFDVARYQGCYFIRF